jgi:hypothetical protein
VVLCSGGSCSHSQRNQPSRWGRDAVVPADALPGERSGDSRETGVPWIGSFRCAGAQGERESLDLGLEDLVQAELGLGHKIEGGAK